MKNVPRLILSHHPILANVTQIIQQIVHRQMPRRRFGLTCTIYVLFLCFTFLPYKMEIKH